MTAHRVTSKGQVTLPKAMRDALGIRTSSMVVFELEDGWIKVVPDSEDAKVRAYMHPLIARMKSHSARATMSADEVMALTRGYEA